MKYRLILLLIVAMDALILFFEASRLSISSAEAYLLYHENSFLQAILSFSLSLFGQNDFSLRAPFFFFHFSSIFLMYGVSTEYLKSERNRIWLLVTFILLPGVVSSAVIASHAGFLIFGLLLFFYIQRYKNETLDLVVLSLLSVADSGFAYLLLGTSIYYLSKKQRYAALYTFILYLLSVYLYGFTIHGYPRGHFLDTIGLYSAIFTPVIFVYLFYVLYRRYLTGKKDKLWYVATTALLFSLFTSFRQKIDIEEFAPYLIVALPLAAQTFSSSYRVRLKEHRKAYKMMFVAAFAFLTLNTLVVFFNKELYLLLDNPKKNFVYNMDIAKELAKNLHSKGVTCISSNEKMQRRLRFYGIKKCNKYKLQELPVESDKKADVTISYRGVVLYKADVTKLNKK